MYKREKMMKLRITGWRPGLLKVSMTLLLRSELDIALRPAKDITDSVLAGEIVELEIEDLDKATRLRRKLHELGADVEIEEESAV